MNTRARIFLTLFITYAFFTNTYLTTNDASRFSLTAAIVEERTLHIDHYLDRVISEWWIPKDFAAYNGHIYSDKAPLGSFLAVPIYILARFFTHNHNVIAYLVSLFTSGALTAATAVLIYEIGGYLTKEEGKRVSLALAYGLATPALFYATVFFSHSITAFFAFAAYYLLYKAKREEKVEKYFVLSGIASALATSSDYYAAIIAAALFFYALSIEPRKAYLFLWSFLVALTPLFTYHRAIFESPFALPYLYSNLYTQFHSRGFYGIALPDRELLANLASQLFAGWGFFYTTPLAIPALAALPRFWRNSRAEAGLTLLIAAGLFYVAGEMGFFDAYSSRHLTPLLPFLFLPLFTLKLGDKLEGGVFYTLSITSLAINFAGVDIFLPRRVNISELMRSSESHNIVGELLLQRGLNLHHLTLLPLILIYSILWRREALRGIRGLILGS